MIWMSAGRDIGVSFVSDFIIDSLCAIRDKELYYVL